MNQSSTSVRFTNIALVIACIGTLTAAPAVSAAAAPQPVPTKSVATANALLASWGAGHDSAGCSAAVALNDDTLWAGVSGQADLEQSVPITPTTLFNAGSVSKPVTALSVLLLERDGRLSLDDSIVKYLPDLPAIYKPVLIRQLLSHTSGVREWQDLLLFMGSFRRDDELRTDDVMRVLRAQDGLNFAPGTQVQYSNSNYILLGELVRVVSGLSLPQFADKRIFVPLHMNNSRLVDDHTALIPHIANGHQKDDPTGWEVVPRTWDLVGPSNLYTSAGDLLKLLAASTRPDWKELLTRMQTPATLADGRPAADDAAKFAGLGFWIRMNGGLTLAGHSGVTHGTRASAYRVRESGYSVAVLCNRNELDPDTIAMQLLDAFTGQGWTASLDTTPPASKPLDAQPAGIARFAGVYQQPQTHLPYRVSTAEGALFLGRPGVRRLQPLADGTNSVADGGDARISFEMAGDTARMKLLNGGAREVETYLRVSSDFSYTPTAAEVEALSGCYASSELGVVVQLRAGANGSLELIDAKGRTRVFEATLPHLWRKGFDTLDFERPASGSPVSFTRSTELAWGIRYQRCICNTTRR